MAEFFNETLGHSSKIGGPGFPNVGLGSQLASERNPGTSNQYGASVPESNGTVINGITAVDVSVGVPALLFGLINGSGAAVSVTLAGLLDQNGVAKNLVVSVPANGRMDFNGIKFNTNLSVTAATTDVITVEWRAQ